MPALLEALHRIIPSARNLFDWIDSDGHIERYYFEGPIDHKIARLYFDEFYNQRERDAMPAFSDLAQGSTVIRSAQELDRASFYDSALYNEIWRPQDLALPPGGDHPQRRREGARVDWCSTGRRPIPIFSSDEEDVARTLDAVHRPRAAVAGESARSSSAAASVARRS